MFKHYKELYQAYQVVREGTFIIPEEVPANERTAFHGAAAAAHKAGKSHFNFGGNKYPVTMKKDTAKAIADETECPKCEGKGCDHCDGKGTHEAYKSCSGKTKKENFDPMNNEKITIKKKVKKGEDDPQQNNGETAKMNPKVSEKNTVENVRSADKRPEKYIGPDGKTHVRMVPTDREVVKKESVDMSIRDKLFSVLEKKDHGNTDQKQAYDDNWSPSAKKMRDDNKDTGEYLDLEKKSHDDASKAGRVTKPSAKNPTDKDTKGDKNIINPVKDTTKVGKGDPSVKESFAQVVKSLGDAYKSMYEKKEEVMEDAEKHKKMAAAHKEKMLDAKEEDHRDGMTAHRMAHDAHMAAAKEYDKAPDSHTATKAKIAGQKAMDHSKKANSVFD